MHIAKPFKRQITVLCIIHKEVDTFCNAVCLLPKTYISSSLLNQWPNPGTLQPPTPPSSLQVLLDLDAARKPTPGTGICDANLQNNVFSSSKTPSTTSLYSVNRRPHTPRTSFSLWYLNPAHRRCLKTRNIKASVKTTRRLQGGPRPVSPLKPSVHSFSSSTGFLPLNTDLLHPQWFGAKGSRAAKSFFFSHSSFYVLSHPSSPRSSSPPSPSK